MTELNNKDIEKFFSILNKKLAEKNQTAEIIICGGASMALLYDRSIITKDIDGMIISTDVKMDLLEYVRQIGEEYELDEDWFNESAKGFLTDLKGNWSEQKQEALKFSNLTVSSVSAEQLLTLKLAAARTDSRDIQDAIKLINHLGIQNESEALDMLEKNIYRGHLTAQVEYFTRYAFNKRTKETEKGENKMPKKIVPTTPMIKTVLTGRLGNVNVAERELENGEKMRVANFKIYATDVNSPSKTVELKKGLGEITRDIPLNCSAWGAQAEYIEELSKKEGLKTITGAATFHYDSKHPEQPRFIMTKIDKENEIARQMNSLIRDYESGKVESFIEGGKTPSVKSNDFDKTETLGKEAKVDKSGEKDKDAKTL